MDGEIERGLQNSGALLIKGPRACGKTSSAKQFAKSSISLDRNTAEVNLAKMEPASALAGEKPRLIDEWQEIPQIWNEVRHAVDEAGAGTKGQFILTGSATPDDELKRHSGAGRIRSVKMRTMTLAERNVDPTAEVVSLTKIIDGSQSNTLGSKASVTYYANWIVAGGFPGFIGLEPLDAQEGIESYLTEMSEHDYPELGGAKRDPRRFMAFLRAYAGLISQPATASAIRKRIGELSGSTAIPANETVNTFHDFANRLFLVEDQPAWSTNVRSKTQLVQTPKRQLADSALAAALLGIGPNALLQDLETFGILFEAQVVHDLRVFTQALRVKGIFHLRDMRARYEIDAILELRDGNWVGVEIKLSHQEIDKAANQLLSVSEKITTPPKALIVVIPSGPAIKRPDGVWVVPLTALRP